MIIREFPLRSRYDVHWLMPTRDPEGSTDVILRARTSQLVAVALSVIEGPDRGARIALQPGTARVGTAPACALRVSDPTVSRLHCEITVGRDAIRLVDSGSTNGTFVDGVRVHDAELATGASVRIGATVLRVERAGEPIEEHLSTRDRFGPVLGASVEMRRLYARMERVASTDATVLIEGETGTGKELVARALHDASKRATRPFVTVDCGAIAEELIESELFGHKRGAFSGAVADREGLFEAAQGGTIFLDEIGELPVTLQPKLLRVLEAREIRRVGGNTTTKVDVRVVAATNRSLARSVNDGSFREDLYYRLAVAELRVPPLRQRRDDIPVLVEAFHERFTGEHASWPAETIAGLMARSWPGNVRELRNFVERSVSLGVQPPPVLVDDRPDEPGAVAVPTHLPLKEARVAWTEKFERIYVRALLERTSGNVTHAAEIAGVNRRSLQRLIAQLGLRPAEDGGDDQEP